MNDRYPHVTAYVRSTPWALDPRTMMVMLDVFRARHAGVRLSREVVHTRLKTKRAGRPDVAYVGEDLETRAVVGRGQPMSATATAGQPAASLIAVIGVYGVIAQRSSLMDEFLGPVGTSVERLSARFRGALRDPAVKAIVFDVDSPGGAIYGTPEFADEIRQARGRKPIEAVSNSLMASGAYYLGSAADKVWVTPSGEAGSIGVYAVHIDISKELLELGEKVTLVQYGQNKTLGNSFEPLSEEARADMEKRVNEYGTQFDRAVAKSRGVTTDVVRQRFGQGLIFGAREAVTLGLADGVATLDEVVGRLARSRTASVPSEVAALRPEPAQDARAAALHAAALAEFYGAEREAAASRARIM